MNKHFYHCNDLYIIEAAPCLPAGVATLYPLISRVSSSLVVIVSRRF